MLVIYFLSGLLILSYIWLIFSFNRGWNNIPDFSSEGESLTAVTVIIPFRNEADNISSLLKSLKCQDYTTGRWNILFVNDHSIDNSSQIIDSGIKEFKNTQILNLPPGLSGKKSAMEYGAKRTQAELLIFTDADCLPDKTWISSIVAVYEKYSPVLISAPVIMDARRSYLSRFQALEFLSLFASGAGSFGIGNPIMANGANIAVRRDIFIENLAERKNSIPSGDDIFLLLSLKKKYPGKLIFLKSKDAFIRTLPMPDLKSFISQRLRWTSKARYYKDYGIILTASIVFLINFWLLIFLFISIFVPGFFILWVLIFLFKSLTDYVFLKKVAVFTGQSRLLKFFVLSQLVYFLYIGFIGIIGNFSSYRWKERKICI